MAEAAASKALANSGVAAADIDFVLVATCTMPEPVPAAAPQLATRLGIDAPGAYDISSGCSGFVYAVDAAVGRDPRRPGPQRARRRRPSGSPAGWT